MMAETEEERAERIKAQSARIEASCQRIGRCIDEIKDAEKKMTAAWKKKIKL